ncbi:hypothetical protein [Acidihalobacter prosperus]|uniref:EAL domain-containing protein n=1 Tax=Acidihalobacter prosperus TaxID=160660 RepID=A0A1A6C4Q3_9GAMM|nr:hypothetical protein [Acidihalobacter prosperus]OBS09534.1 hypothetical protein Thpro_021862 [Acidihalobacter prosperus]
MNHLERYPLDELKLIYRTLHAALPENPELMDSVLLEELQGYLQTRAREAGVDVSLHAQWAAWLGGELLRGL